MGFMVVLSEMREGPEDLRVAEKERWRSVTTALDCERSC